MTRHVNYSPSYGDQAPSAAPQSSREESATVGRSPTERAGQVANVAGEQTRQVASETRRQARNLFDQGADQLRVQAREGQQKAAGSLRDLADQFRQMCDRNEGSGVASDLVRQASDQARDAASWLESREPGDLLNEIRSFARRRPGAFLAAATIAGVVVGRLTRNVMSSQKTDHAHRGQPADRVAADTGYPATGPSDPRTAQPAPGTYPARPAPPSQSGQSAGAGQPPQGYPSQSAYGSPPPQAPGPANYPGTGAERR
jgi:hypothetical protein